MAKLKGSTSQGQEIARREQAADAPFLAAAFWEKGTTLTGEVLSVHKSGNGPYVAVELSSPPSVQVYDNEGNLNDHAVVRIGNLAGISLARRAALREEKNKYFAVGDVIELTCTGITPATKEGYSDSPNFVIGIDRKEPVF
jgi:hypothetical protein